jgi:hypothetical protein
MVINPLNTNYITTYSIGIEKKYHGNAIEYDDNYKVFIFYYYPNYTRAYIIDGKEQNIELPQIDDKVRKICHIENTAARALKKFIKGIKSKNLFALPDQFFQELYILLNARKKSYCTMLQLYNYYERKLVDESNIIN